MSASQKAQCFHSFAANRQLCLPANTHLVFLGESTMRFQYLLLAWALLHQIEYRDRDLDPADPRRLHNIASFSKGGMNAAKARARVVEWLPAGRPQAAPSGHVAT